MEKRITLKTKEGHIIYPYTDNLPEDFEPVEFSTNFLNSGTIFNALKSSEDKANEQVNNLHEQMTQELNSLEESLNEKANSAHTHETSEINGLEESLNEKANSVHTHETSEINGLEESLNEKASLYSDISSSSYSFRFPPLDRNKCI